MHLKKLEITGFKSFANKTAMEFNKSVTAVVGPNGSGKSNIADAMRWVLGEQGLRGLRLKSSEDLIFAGSNKKARLGAAQVFLCLDNDIPVKKEGGSSEEDKLNDFPEEIIIGRKYFRNGESEYYINNKLVRLKDVVHLAARVGVGTRSYAIITQGMADAILSASPKDRRIIFEEAAGVKLFQLKKEETLRKLNSTKTNLVRVDDLLREILPHLKFLERQAKKAEKRQKLEDELNEKQGQFYSFKIDYLEKKLKDINNEQNSLNQKIIALVKELGNAQEALKTENNKVNQKDKEEIELENKLNELQNKRNDLTRETALLEGKADILRQFARSATPGQITYAETVSELRVDEAASDIEEIFEAYKKLEEKVLKAGTAEELLLIKEEFKIFGEKIRILHKKLNLDSQKNSSEAAVKTADKTNPDKKNTELDQLNRKKTALQQELNKVNTDIESLRAGFQKIKEQERINRKNFFDLERQARFNEDQILLSESKLKDLSIQEERLNIERQEIVNSIKEYGIELTPAGQMIDSNRLEIEISRLKRQLEEIGGIDELVIKEFQETSERYTFLLKESRDLEKADKDLREAIGVLNYKINHQFNEKFREINEEFDKYFKMIFGGGKAFLKKIKEPNRKRNKEDDTAIPQDDGIEPEDKEEIIEEDGIDIKVNLPNKKIENINVMSGGERALTSIAVLFAIIGANPPPFCVLDEVDAALDDANAYRFSKILEELSERTQFVLITHNRETMRAANVLYGITMEEEGVSKLVSVKLEG